jgi:predicted hydrocarbon binding protein
MKGIFFVQLKNYILTRYGEKVWNDIFKQAKIGSTQLYFSSQVYDEEDFFRIIKTMLKFTGQTPEKFFENLGEHITPYFLNTCKPIMNPKWKSLDVIEHFQEFNYHLLQTGEESINTGTFVCKRLDENHAFFTYQSPRKLCAAIAGLIKGIAAHFNESLLIQQSECMLEGFPECRFHITRTNHGVSMISPLLKMEKESVHEQ